ncbi:MAG: TIGR04282 family arsenosugar biosynthesis glycosyltransferase [Sphingomonadales bacterium]
MRLTRIVIFAKAPVPGQVKTRLAPVLGMAGAARLARAMFGEICRRALDTQFGPVELCLAPERAAPAWRSVALPHGADISAQGDGDLGARMARASQRVLAGGENILLIGTDCLDLTTDLLNRAAAALDAHDAVIHPAHDGGYTLLGLRQYHDSLFSDIAWSSDGVAEETLARLSALGWRTRIGEVLHDIDRPSDLERLPLGWRRKLGCAPGPVTERA